MSIDQEPKDSNKRIGMGMVVLAWLSLIGLIAVFFSQWMDKQHNPNQTLNQNVSNEGVREVELTRNRYGHYVVTGAINGQPVQLMLDTGASDISIPHKLAIQLGLKQGAPITYQTANGPITNYATVLDSVAIGNIELHNVRASINPHVKDTDVLLGMTFLKHLEFTQRGRQLILRQWP